MSDAWLDNEIANYSVVVGMRAAMMWAQVQGGVPEPEVLVSESKKMIDSDMTREQLASLAATALMCYATAEAAAVER